jgi:hypothetical protein
LPLFSSRSNALTRFAPLVRLRGSSFFLQIKYDCYSTIPPTSLTPVGNKPAEVGEFLVNVLACAGDAVVIRDNERTTSAELGINFLSKFETRIIGNCSP